MTEAPKVRRAIGEVIHFLQTEDNQRQDVDEITFHERQCVILLAAKFVRDWLENDEQITTP